MIMSWINLFCEMSLFHQVLYCIPITLVACGIIYIVLWCMLACVMQFVSQLVNAAEEREVYDATWMDAEKWEEA